MSQKAFLLIPILGMILLTVSVALLMLKQRYKAVLEGGISPAYFKLNRGAKLPDYVIQVTQHYENLFEAPVLFYCAILFILVLEQVDSIYVILSWLYFLSRMLHAYVHINHNRLRQRRNIFLVSSFILIILWLKLAINIIQVQ